MSGGVAANILQKKLFAYSRTDEEVAPWVRGDLVSFYYDSGSFIANVFTVPAVARYRLTDGQAHREGPLALTVGGFIHEWLELTRAEAEHWGTHEAAQTHAALAAEGEQQVAELENVSRCSGPIPIWEVAIRFSRSKKIRVYRIEGDRATKLRMLEAAGKTSDGCIGVGPHSLEAIRKELPW